MCVNAPRSKGPGKARRLPSKALPTSFAKSSHQRCCTPLRRQGPATTNCVTKCRPWSVDHVRRGCSQDKGPFRGLSSLVFLHQSQRRRGKGFASLPRKEKVDVERTESVPTQHGGSSWQQLWTTRFRSAHASGSKGVNFVPHQRQTNLLGLPETSVRRSESL